MSPQLPTNQPPIFVLTVGSGGSGTSLDDAVRSNNATSAAQVNDFNQKLIADYHLKYITYVTRMQSGGVVRPEDQKVPVPPFAYQLSQPDSNGYVYPEQGLLPVCPPGPAVNYNGGIPSIASGGGQVEGKIVIGVHLFGSYYQTGQDDTWPADTETGPQPDGHNYYKIPTIGSTTITWPDGTTGTHSGWYLRLS